MAITGTASGYLYYGPHTTNYERDISISGIVKVLWREGSWYYVETNTTPKRRNYIASLTNINGGNPPTYTPTLLTRYANTGASATYPTYLGPATSYVQAGSIDRGEAVKYLDTKKEGDYALVEYTVAGTGKKKRAWFEHMKLTVADPYAGSMDSQLNNVLANLSNQANYGSGSFYKDYVGQCTWYCWGRAKEKCQKTISFVGTDNNGGMWYDNVNYSASNVIKRAASLGPVNNSVCSCSGSTYRGHVVFVEKVEGQIVYYTEANVGGTDGALKKCWIYDFPKTNRTAYGYIVC